MAHGTQLGDNPLEEHLDPIRILLVEVDPADGALVDARREDFP